MSETPLELWANSAEAWMKRVGSGDFARDFVLDAPMLRLLGDLNGKQALDVGCGEGRFSRAMKQHGASVTGIEPTEALLRRASELDGESEYILGKGEDLPFPDASFDVAVFYLVLLDIPDYRQAVREAARVLKSGGRIVVADMQSFITASPEWRWDESDATVNLKISNYFGERGEVVEWADIRVVNFHRPLSLTLDAFIDAGLKLTVFEEPRPERAPEEHPSAKIGQVCPWFYIAEWLKV